MTTHSHLPTPGNSGGLGLNQAPKPLRSPLNLSRVRKIIRAMKPSRHARGEGIHTCRETRRTLAKLLVARVLADMQRDLCAIVDAECGKAGA